MDAQTAYKMNSSTNQELKELAMLSIGRILRMGSRPEQAGDNQEYSKYRQFAIDAMSVLKERGLH